LVTPVISLHIELAGSSAARQSNGALSCYTLLKHSKTAFGRMTSGKPFGGPLVLTLIVSCVAAVRAMQIDERLYLLG